MLCLCRKNRQAIAGTNVNKKPTNPPTCDDVPGPTPPTTFPCLKVDGTLQGSVALAAGELQVGTIGVSVDSQKATITVQTIGGYYLNNVFLWYGTSIDDLPTTGCGWPQTSVFPIRDSFTHKETITTYTVPFKNYKFACPSSAKPTIYYVAKTIVSLDGPNGPEPEFAYAQGTVIDDDCGGRCGPSASYGSFQLLCCTPTPSQTTASETAYAMGDDKNRAICFKNVPGLSNKWGWTNGPYQRGDSGVWQLWAGAAGCDTSKGYFVGTFTWSFDATGKFTGTYQARTNGTKPVYFSSTHLYIGADPLPKKNGSYTDAPGQYGNVHENLGTPPAIGVLADTYVVTTTAQRIYIVAHAVSVTK